MSSKKEESRRKFIKTAGKAAVVAPAVTVILNAALIPEVAASPSSRPPVLAVTLSLSPLRASIDHTFLALD